MTVRSRCQVKIAVASARALLSIDGSILLMLLGPFFLIILYLTIIVSALIIISSVVRGRQATDSECGRCGYSVRELTTFTCPECGEDLRQVGIITPNIKRPVHPAFRILVWSLLLPIIAVVLSSMALSLLPIGSYQDQSLMLGQPVSGQYAEISMEARVRTDRGVISAPPKRINLHVLDVNRQPAPSLLINFERNEIRSDHPDGGLVAQTPLTIDHLVEYLRRSEIDVEQDTDQINAEMLAVLQQVNQFAAGNLTASHSTTVFMASGGGTRSAPPPAWLVVSTIAFWTLIWLFGCSLLLVSGKKRRKP